MRRQARLSPPKCMIVPDPTPTPTEPLAATESTLEAAASLCSKGFAGTPPRDPSPDLALQSLAIPSADAHYRGALGIASVSSN